MSVPQSFKSGSYKSGITVLEWLTQPLSDVQSLYWVTGAEEFLRERVLSKLRQEILEQGFAEFNHQVLRLTANSKPASLLDALLELPVMTERRLLELQNVQELNIRVADELCLFVQKESLHPGLVVVMVGDTPKTKSGLWKYLQTHARVLTCEIEAKQQSGFVTDCCQQHRLKLTPKQLQILTERTAGNLRLIAGTVERLAIYAGASASISDAELDQMVYDSTEVQTWKLTQAIGQSDLKQAWSCLEKLMQREQPQSLLSYLNTYLLGLAQVAQLKARLKTPAAIAKELPRRSEFQIKKSLEELGSWNEVDLRNAFERLARADFRIKTGSEPLLVMQLLVLQLCNRMGARR